MTKYRHSFIFHDQTKSNNKHEPAEVISIYREEVIIGKNPTNLG